MQTLRPVVVVPADDAAIFEEDFRSAVRELVFGEHRGCALNRDDVVSGRPDREACETGVDGRARPKLNAERNQGGVDLPSSDQAFVEIKDRSLVPHRVGGGGAGPPHDRDYLASGQADRDVGHRNVRDRDWMCGWAVRRSEGRIRVGLLRRRCAIGCYEVRTESVQGLLCALFRFCHARPQGE